VSSIKDLICGFKDSGSEESGIHDYMAALGGSQRSASYLCGNEALLIQGVKAGADGLVPSMANVFPQLWQSIWQNRSDAAKLQRLTDLVTEINHLNSRYASSLGSVMWKKQVLSIMGIIPPTMSWPSQNAASDDVALLRSLIQRVDQTLSEILDSTAENG
jgi:dihydrodipicolinate synthase/N-acetylneuraminate lyase